MASLISLFKNKHEKAAINAFRAFENVQKGASKKIAHYVLFNKDPSAVKIVEDTGRQRLTAMGFYFPRDYIGNGAQNPKRLKQLRATQLNVANFVSSEAFQDPRIAKRFAHIMLPACNLESLGSYGQFSKDEAQIVYFLSEIQASAGRAAEPKQYWSTVTADWFKAFVNEYGFGDKFVIVLVQ